MAANGSPNRKLTNVNVGVLGHVDSGKTSLCKTLSTISSTACFDKNPQSQERGITLDLGFSSFLLNTNSDSPIPSKDGTDSTIQEDEVQITLVDCPGHASLIRTIIGGANIIDLMILVVDAIKGIQTQTAECIVLAEILCSNRKMPLIVVANKVDLFPQTSRREKTDKIVKKLRATFKQTLFGDDVSIVPFSCIAQCNDDVSTDHEMVGGESNKQSLMSTLRNKVVEILAVNRSSAEISDKSSTDQFLFSVDHCFSIKGQGTVMTGTCLQGKVSVNDKVDIATLSMERKVKSIQVFRQPVASIQKGDRAGICMTQFESSLLERGLVCYPGLLRNIYGCILPLNFVRFYKGSVTSNSKFHIVVGHETTMAKLTCFATSSETKSSDFSFDHEYEFCPQVNQNEKREMKIFVLLQFEKTLLAPPDCVIIGSKLDSDILTNNCRIAFYGKPSEVFFDSTYAEKILPSLKVFKEKQKRGMVDRIFSEDTIICKNMLKKESNIEKFVRLKVELSTGDKGVIIGGFGQSGKIKVQLTGAPMSQALKDAFVEVGRKGAKKAAAVSEDSSDVSNSTNAKTPVAVVLKFKKMLFSLSSASKLVQ